MLAPVGCSKNVVQDFSPPAKRKAKDPPSARLKFHNPPYQLTRPTDRIEVQSPSNGTHAFNNGLMSDT